MPERGRIFDGIMRISDAPITEMVAPEVADPFPEEVPMQELPTDIIREIPLIRGHKFVKFDDRILVVSSSRLVCTGPLRTRVPASRHPS